MWTDDEPDETQLHVYYSQFGEALRGVTAQGREEKNEEAEE